MKKLKNVILLVTLLSISACHISKITHSWKAQEAPTKDYTKILVLGFIRNADRNIEEKMENHFVGDLQTLGYNAVSSLKEYGPKVFDKIDEAEGIAKLKNSSFDVVITIVLLKKKEKENIFLLLITIVFGFIDMIFITAFMSQAIILQVQNIFGKQIFMI